MVMVMVMVMVMMVMMMMTMMVTMMVTMMAMIMMVMMSGDDDHHHRDHHHHHWRRPVQCPRTPITSGIFLSSVNNFATPLTFSGENASDHFRGAGSLAYSCSRDYPQGLQL